MKENKLEIAKNNIQYMINIINNLEKDLTFKETMQEIDQLKKANILVIENVIMYVKQKHIKTIKSCQ